VARRVDPLAGLLVLASNAANSLLKVVLSLTSSYSWSHDPSCVASLVASCIASLVYVTSFVFWLLAVLLVQLVFFDQIFTCCTARPSWLSCSDHR